MERGNLQSATFQIGGKEQKMFITPNPGLKSLRAFDEKNQKVSLSELMQKDKQEQTNKQENKQEVSQTQSEKKSNKIKNDQDAPAKKTRKRQKIAH